MKRILLYFAVVAIAALAFVGCGKEDDNFNAENLYSGSGNWSFYYGSNEMLQHFSSDGTGWERNITQNTPQQAFTWELAGSRLTFTHQGESGGGFEVPIDYTVTTLNDISLVYKDSMGKVTSCSKERGVE